MKENGQRQKPGDNPRGINSRAARPLTTSVTLSDLGITKDQASKWQQLAAVPRDEFERAVNGDGRTVRNRYQPAPCLELRRINALWVCFE